MFTAHTDGGCRGGNPGRAAWAFVIYDESGNEFWNGSGALPNLNTNNVAEYHGMIECLSWWTNHKQPGQKITVYTDSQLVANQLNGVYQVKDWNLGLLAARARTMLDGSVTIVWVRRLQNKRADEIYNETRDIADRELGIERS